MTNNTSGFDNNGMKIHSTPYGTGMTFALADGNVANMAQLIFDGTPFTMCFPHDEREGVVRMGNGNGTEADPLIFVLEKNDEGIYNFATVDHAQTFKGLVTGAGPMMIRVISHLFHKHIGNMKLASTTPEELMFNTMFLGAAVHTKAMLEFMENDGTPRALFFEKIDKKKKQVIGATMFLNAVNFTSISSTKDKQGYHDWIDKPCQWVTIPADSGILPAGATSSLKARVVDGVAIDTKDFENAASSLSFLLASALASKALANDVTAKSMEHLFNNFIEFYYNDK